MNVLSLSEILTALLLAFLGTVPPEPAENGLEAPGIRAQAEASHTRVAEAVAGKDRFWAAPFVLADKEAREVTVWGQMTGMVLGDPVEFFVVGEASGHDYESLMVTFAKPSDIHKALEFIGLSPGGPVDPDQHRFWPRGDKVNASLELILPGAEAPSRIPAHQWITRPDDSVMPATAWVFTGAPLLPSPEDPEILVYAADQFSPNSVASTFNLRNTVFDLPFQGSKTVVYGNFLRNPALETQETQPVFLRLVPAAEGDFPPERDQTLTFNRASFEPDLSHVAEHLAQVRATLEAEPDTVAYLTLDFAGDLPVSVLRTLATTFATMEEELDQVRIEPPPAGHLYYQAFNPPERFRERARRPSQPLELHIRQDPGGTRRATVMELEEIWGEARTPTIVERRRMMETPAEWLEYLQKNPPEIQVLFVYAPGALTHAELMQWLGPVLERFPVVYVYDLDE